MRRPPTPRPRTVGGPSYPTCGAQRAEPRRSPGDATMWQRPLPPHRLRTRRSTPTRSAYAAVALPRRRSSRAWDSWPGSGRSGRRFQRGLSAPGHPRRHCAARIRTSTHRRPRRRHGGKSRVGVAGTTPVVLVPRVGARDLGLPVCEGEKGSLSGAEVLGDLLREQNSRRIGRCCPQERDGSGRDLVQR